MLTTTTTSETANRNSRTVKARTQHRKAFRQLKSSADGFRPNKAWQINRPGLGGSARKDCFDMRRTLISELSVSYQNVLEHRACRTHIKDGNFVSFTGMERGMRASKSIDFWKNLFSVMARRSRASPGRGGRKSTVRPDRPRPCIRIGGEA